MFDKLKFWKKKEGLDDFDPLAHDPMGGQMEHPQGESKYQDWNATNSYQQPGLGEAGGLGGEPGLGQPGQPQAFQDAAQHTAPQAGGKDIELLSAKLDAIKAQMDVINQRLIKIEKIAEGEYEMMKKNKYQW